MPQPAEPAKSQLRDLQRVMKRYSVVLRDLGKTLTDETANALRDRIYRALHQGTEYQWAG